MDIEIQKNSEIQDIITKIKELRKELVIQVRKLYKAQKDEQGRDIRLFYDEKTVFEINNIIDSIDKLIYRFENNSKSISKQEINQVVLKLENLFLDFLPKNYLCYKLKAEELIKELENKKLNNNLTINNQNLELSSQDNLEEEKNIHQVSIKLIDYIERIKNHIEKLEKKISNEVDNAKEDVQTKLSPFSFPKEYELIIENIAEQKKESFTKYSFERKTNTEAPQIGSLQKLSLEALINKAIENRQNTFHRMVEKRGKDLKSIRNSI